MDSGIHETFSSNLRKFRTDKNLTQTQLAHLIRATRMQVINWECGRSLPSLTSLIALSRALNVTLDTLVFGQVHV
jgi:transcriptional regulator with XRE-family HTH domain